MTSNHLIKHNTGQLSSEIRSKIVITLANAWGFDPAGFDPNMLIGGQPLLWHLAMASEGWIEYDSSRFPHLYQQFSEAFDRSRNDPQSHFESFFTNYSGTLDSFLDTWKKMNDSTNAKEYLLKYGVSGRDNNKLAVTQEYASITALLLIAAGADPNYTNPERQNISVLSQALTYKNMRLAKALYLAGADVVVPTSNALFRLPFDITPFEQSQQRIWRDTTDFIDTVINNEGLGVLNKTAPLSQDDWVEPAIYGDINGPKGNLSWAETRLKGLNKRNCVTDYISDKLLEGIKNIESASPYPSLTLNGTPTPRISSVDSPKP
jgi:hypothetical protein